MLYFDCENKSTTSGKENYVDLERDVLRQIVESVAADDNILILDNKDECRNIEHLIKTNEEFLKLKDMGETADQEVIRPVEAINYFAMRGRNNWGEFNKCYCIQQPQIIFPYYVFLYEYWSKEKLKDKEIYLANYVDNETRYKTYGFSMPKTLNGEEIINTEEEIVRNKQLELLRQTSQVSSIYQGIKRIQRNTNPKGEFYVITTDKNILNILKSQFKNIKAKFFKFDIECKAPEKESDTAVKRLNNWVNISPDNVIISYEEIAELCETSLENLKKIFTRHKDVLEKFKQKHILIYDFNHPVSWLANIDKEEQKSVNEFEKQFNVSWKSFKRNKYAIAIIKQRNIVVSKGQLVANI